MYGRANWGRNAAEPVNDAGLFPVCAWQGSFTEYVLNRFLCLSHFPDPEEEEEHNDERDAADGRDHDYHDLLRAGQTV